MSEVERVKVAIVGSGPAGWTAAIYAGRANLAPVIFEGLQPGGQLTITTEVENYPGFAEGIQGPDLMMQFKAQAMRFDVTCYSENISEADLSKRPFRLKSDQREILADAVIISTGATARYLGAPGEDAFHNKGLSACATCDGFFFRGKELVVVGGGDSACEEANFLTKFATKVTMVHRRDEFRASKIMAQRVIDNPKIDIRWNTNLVGYHGDDNGMIEAVDLENVNSGEVERFATQGVFMAIGHVPNTGFLNGQIDLDKKGYIVTKPDCTYTNVEGVFACGDVQDSTYRQAVTAAGSGCMAAIDAERWLEEQHG
ncbi:MAG: thioredoxin-disulfide reductase [Planctomycetota bacterium]